MFRRCVFKLLAILFCKITNIYSLSALNNNLSNKFAKMTKLDFVDQAKIALDEELSNTGYTNGYILQLLYENNKKFVDLMGEKKVVEVCFCVFLG
jgi:hypothetical protein